MNERWTKPRTDGKKHGPNDKSECAHCDHVYQGFNQVEVMSHCRENHREFYKHKWDTEIAVVNPNAAEVYPDFVPLD